MKLLFIVGTRPNFMKVAPLIQECKNQKMKYKLVHTGQHYDENLSTIFFEELQLPKPDIHLNIKSGSSTIQTSLILKELQPVLVKEKPTLIIVVGDVTSTVASALCASQHKIPVAHVEAGLRSFDRSMPEEINRIIVDHISELLFTTEPSANQNLEKERISSDKIHFVGNTMIDTLLTHKQKAKQTPILKNLNIIENEYALLTVHRPSNVDEKNDLERTLQTIKEIAKHIQVVWSIHPRTKNNIKKNKLEKEIDDPNIITLPPCGYLDFINLMANAKVVVTDSGGIQEETTVLNVPCITLRENTERPITLQSGTNKLISTDKTKVINTLKAILKQPRYQLKSLPEKWDGKASKRIIQTIKQLYHKN